MFKKQKENFSLETKGKQIKKFAYKTTEKILPKKHREKFCLKSKGNFFCLKTKGKQKKIFCVQGKNKGKHLAFKKQFLTKINVFDKNP